MYKTELKIDGMACGMCETHINDCIRNNFEIKKIKTSHKKGESVFLSEEKPDESKISKIITETGYTLLSIDTTVK